MYYGALRTYQDGSLGQATAPPADVQAPPYLMQTQEGVPCLKADAFDALSGCEAIYQEYVSQLGANCLTMEGAMTPECQSKAEALNASFDWGNAICKDYGQLKAMAASVGGDMAAELEMALEQTRQLNACDGRTPADRAAAEADAANGDAAGVDNTLLYGAGLALVVLAGVGVYYATRG